MPAGVIAGFIKKEIKLISFSQKQNKSIYTYVITKKIRIKAKTKEEYHKLNILSKVMLDFNLTDALKNKLLTIDNNRILFRSKILGAIEPTLFHLISNAGLLLDEVPKISFKYFKGLVERDASDERKLILLKNLLQVMGWGIITIEMESKNNIKVIIDHPPYGLQKEKDNWEFLIRTIQGYLWLINRKLKVKKRRMIGKKLMIDFGT
jgi:hypothetical protein